MGSMSSRIKRNTRLRRGHDDRVVRRRGRIDSPEAYAAARFREREVGTRCQMVGRIALVRMSNPWNGRDCWQFTSSSGDFLYEKFLRCGLAHRKGGVPTPGLARPGSSEPGFVRNQFERLAEQVFETVMIVSPSADQGIGAVSIRVRRCIILANRRVWSSGSPHHVRYGCRRDWRCRRRAGFASASRTSSRPRRRRFPPRPTPDE